MCLVCTETFYSFAIFPSIVMKQKVIHFLEIHFCNSSILGYSFAALLQYIFHFDKPKWYIGETKEIQPYHYKRLLWCYYKFHLIAKVCNFFRESKNIAFYLHLWMNWHLATTPIAKMYSLIYFRLQSVSILHSWKMLLSGILTLLHASGKED